MPPRWLLARARARGCLPGHDREPRDESTDDEAEEADDADRVRPRRLGDGEQRDPGNEERDGKTPERALPEPPRCIGGDSLRRRVAVLETTSQREAKQEGHRGKDDRAAGD